MAPLPPPPAPTLTAIYATYETEAGDGFREHLGASQIGKECERALWFDFRWVTRAAWSGRMLRLFDTGQREEERLVRDLRRTGATVLDLDPATGRQWRVEALGGHFGGSLDAVAIGLLEAPKTWHVLEFKTSATRAFNELRLHGVGHAKPRHYAQIQIYLHLTGITRAMYIVVCKETDEIYVERVPVDPAEGARLLARAKRIIEAQHPPARISEDPEFWVCTLCEHRGRMPWRSSRRAHLPLVPARHAGGRRLALRALGLAPAPGRAARRLPAAPLHPRPGPWRGASMPATTGSPTGWLMAPSGTIAGGRPHDPPAAPIPARRDRRDLRLLRPRQRPPARGHSDRRRQVAGHGRCSSARCSRPGRTSGSSSSPTSAS